MHNDLVERGWTEEHWNRICAAVTEEAQKARVAAQMLPLVGPEDGSTLAVPQYALATNNPNPYGYPPGAPQPATRPTVNSNPDLFLTTIAVNVPLRSHEVADLSLNAALGMFRRAATCIARVEDALVFNGRVPPNPPTGLGGLPTVFTVTGGVNPLVGLSQPTIPNPLLLAPLGPARRVRGQPNPAGGRFPTTGNDVVQEIIEAIGDLDSRGQQGPYACALSQDLFALICTPNPNLVLPRDRVLPFLQGPLLRGSALRFRKGVVIALSGNPVELVVGSDITVRYLQTTLEPRYVFRVSERVALRIRDINAIAVLT